MRAPRPRTRMSLQARGLTLARGSRLLFSDLYFSVKAGGALRVLGANGAGKTSLLRVLCGLSRPDEGAVFWHGASIASIRPQFCESLVYLGHAEAVKHDLLAWENLAFGALSGVPGARALAWRTLEAAGLGAQAELPARVLSQGQRKRLALARLRLAPPQSLWVLDEPFSHLDAAASAQLAALLAAHCAGGGMAVYTSHQDEGPAAAATLELGGQAQPAC